MIIFVYKKNGEVQRIGLYEIINGNVNWVKWLSKKKYREYALINNIEIKEIEE